ncbi:hypothetical protein [Nostoc sp. TCL26-01]|uniref:hypothetical protein n=1 Tax=Nostoc sp. TCL26-01 TaxID=2576904 RepID=UPI0015BFF28B|nr:hypothetical protein [Nostoc sp. TCL26-01]QLE57760.1 hypothetical protein FD725_20925 [Nostoc sp. TCL26-01]
MHLHIWKNVLLTILLASSGILTCAMKVDATWVKQLDTAHCQTGVKAPKKNYPIKDQLFHLCQNSVVQDGDSPLPQSDVFDIKVSDAIALDVSPAKFLTAQATEPNSTPPDSPNVSQQNNTPPPLEGQPSEFPPTTPKPIEQLLDSPPINNNERLERLRRRLREIKQRSSQAESYRELGLRVRSRDLPQPLEQPPLPPERTEPKFKPIGSLQARVGFFLTDNIFSSDILPIEDSLFFYGLRLASTYVPVAKNTYLNASIDGNLIRYVNQSKFNYNQIVFGVGIYQQLSRRMYGEIKWSNQQLFYARNSDVFQAGDRFLNENAFRLSLGRRDPLTKRLMIDSFYEFSWHLADPDNRSRLINSFWLSLNYYLQKPLQVGLNYQLNLSDFTGRERSDQYHRLYGHLIYRLSNSSSMNIQTGISFGDSTAKNIDFESWFVNVNYNLKVGEF